MADFAVMREAGPFTRAQQANMLGGAPLPNPMTDSSFEKFRDSEKFKKAIAEMDRLN